MYGELFNNVRRSILEAPKKLLNGAKLVLIGESDCVWNKIVKDDAPGFDFRKTKHGDVDINIYKLSNESVF